MSHLSENYGATVTEFYHNLWREASLLLYKAKKKLCKLKLYFNLHNSDIYYTLFTLTQHFF